MYKRLDRMSDEKRDAIQEDSRRFFNAMDSDEKI
jgi:deoxyribodipyrimidine photolyase-related protein